MAEYTQNLNLEKPAENENFRCQVLNGNMDKIDKKFGIVVGEGHEHDGTPGQGKRISYNNLEGKPTVMEPTAHKSSHAMGGSDVITPADIGAETPVGAQAKVDAVKGSLDAHLADNMLHSDSIKGTTQTPTFVNGQLSQIVHKNSGNNIIRTDIYNFTAALITETRTLSTGESLAIKYYFNADGSFNRTEVS